MVSRAAGKALAIIGVILLLASLGGIGYASLPAGDQGTFSLDPGADLFVVDSWGVLAGGTVQGTFTVANGTPISVFVYDQTDYNAYVNGANLSGLYSTTGSSGSLSVNVPGYGTYYVVFQHASGYESQGQDVSVNLTFTGLDPTFSIGGTIAAVVGVALLAVGVRRLRIPQPAPPPWSVPSASRPPSSSWGSTGSSGPDTSTAGAGLYRVPGALPGSAPATNQGPPAILEGTLLVTVENRSAGAENVELLVNGGSQAMITIPSGTTGQARLRAEVTSPYGSTVTVEARTSEGRRTSQAVFVGAQGVVQVSLRIG